MWLLRCPVWISYYASAAGSQAVTSLSYTLDGVSYMKVGAVKNSSFNPNTSLIRSRMRVNMVSYT